MSPPDVEAPGIAVGAALSAEGCSCKATATCATCTRWAGVFDTTRMRRAERLERLLEVAEQRGAVPANARLWMPRRGRWRPYYLHDLDCVETLVGRLNVSGAG